MSHHSPRLSSAPFRIRAAPADGPPRAPLLLLFAALLLGAGCSTSSGARYADDDDYAPGFDDDDASSDDDDAAGDEGDPTEEPPGEEDPEDVEDDVCAQAETVPTTIYMSADDSNSQAAPVLARHKIAAGSRLPGQPQVHEFLNYYDFDLPAAPAGEVALHPQMRPIEGDPGRYSMLVSVAAPDRTMEERRALNLVFSLDTSCSMGGQGMSMAKASMREMAASMRPGDLVSIVSWSRTPETLLDAHEVVSANDPTVLSRVDGLQTGGSTDLHNGLVAAYELAERHHAPERLSRVVLISDGGANTGITDRELIAAHAEDSEGDGIYLVGVGASDPMEYRHDLMDTVTDLGKGSYIYIDTEAEAEHQFRGERFVANLDLAARDVRLEVQLPAGFVVDAFHGEEMSTDPDEVEPQHLGPNDSMQYHFELVDCPEAPGDRDETFRFAVTWQDADTRESRLTESASLMSDLLDGDIRALVKADALIAFAEVLNEVPRLPVEEQAPRLDAVMAILTAAADAFPGDADLAAVRDQLSVLRLRY